MFGVEVRADSLLEMCRVAGTFHRNLRDGIIDISKIVGTQFNFSGADILLKPV